MQVEEGTPAGLEPRLFDDIERTGEEGARHGESKFGYLNRIGRAEAARVRDFMEHCFEQYPAARRADVRARFRARAERHHLGAVAELVWHELLRRLGCEIEPHPVVPGTSKRPEFLVEEPSGLRFYLESVVDTTRDVREAGKEQIKNDVYDKVNALVQSPTFFVGVALRGDLSEQPSVKNVATEIRDWLKTLDPDEVVAAFDATGRLPMQGFEGKGFTLVCDAIPKRRSRGDAGPGIGYIWHGMARLVRTDESVRAAIKEKATRYGRLDLPYLIAVNVVCEYSEKVDILDVLFGSLTGRVWRDQSGRTIVVAGRAPDGLWTGAGDARNNGVSAVLSATRLDEWTLARTELLLTHNPWARLPYSGVLNRFPHVERAGDSLAAIDGESLSDLLGLPSGWPE
jgi:hypothetical protein